MTPPPPAGPGPAPHEHPMPDRPAVSMRDLKRRARENKKIPVLTCYDATTARWLYRGGLDVMLVGDTAGHVVLGFDDTVHAPLDFMLTLTAAVKRGAPKAFIMGDMPFMSYHADDADATRNAGRFITEGRADAVKIEVDERFVGLVDKLDRASIPVVAHIGWRPQRTATTGVPVVAGRTADKIKAMVQLAKRLEDAGASMLLIEQSTAEAAQAVVDATSVPVIGCGAGPACHGQVVVLHDWLGLTDWQPSFVKPAAHGGQTLSDMAKRWVQRVEEGKHLSDGGPYKMQPKG